MSQAEKVGIKLGPHEKIQKVLEKSKIYENIFTHAEKPIPLELELIRKIILARFKLDLLSEALHGMFDKYRSVNSGEDYDNIVDAFNLAVAEILSDLKIK